MRHSMSVEFGVNKKITKSLKKIKSLFMRLNKGKRLLFADIFMGFTKSITTLIFSTIKSVIRP
ncbi:hypothetical protein BTA35_0212605 [Oceanospirillum linum]|uniref:Uncharacterized protein n=1 Tax=Oceanospirillum linum TaxID=966 RepID=A0A1T1HA68_OCELI|nr:hypothetical protein BTA35_0212605 [Oceanospirillum linum]